MCCAVIRRLRDWVINNCLLHLCTWKLLERSIPKECNQADVLQQCWPLLIALCPLLCTLRSTLTITHSSHSQSLSGGWKGAKAFISSFSTASPEEVTEANPHLMKSGKKTFGYDLDKSPVRRQAVHVDTQSVTVLFRTATVYNLQSKFFFSFYVCGVWNEPQQQGSNQENCSPRTQPWTCDLNLSISVQQTTTIK